MFELSEFLDQFEKVRQRTRRVAACMPVAARDARRAPAPSLYGMTVAHVQATSGLRAQG